MAASKEDLKAMCDLNGWGVGTTIRRTNSLGEEFEMVITAVGEDAVLVKYLSERIQGEVILFAFNGDVFTEVLNREQIISQIGSCLNRMEELQQELRRERVLSEQS